MTVVAAHPTTYKGHRFRSRLEARWAALFDRLRWSWDYEPLDLPGWVPDFALRREGRGPVLVEVKPELELGPLLAQHRGRVERSGWAGPVLLVGATAVWSVPPPPFLGLLKRPAKSEWGPVPLHGCPSLCATRSRFSRAVSVALAEGDRCLFCGQLTLLTAAEYPPGYSHAAQNLASFVAARWAEAGRDVQWRGA